MRTKEAFVLKPGETRGTAPLNIFGNPVTVKLAGTDTEDRCAILEDVTQPGTGPPLHRHSREDESFYVVEGTYRFEVDGVQFTAGEGSAVFAPRGTVHTFQNVGASPGRLLIVAQPAGLEKFLTEVSDASSGMSEPDMAVVVPIFEKYGLELLGPPLGAPSAAK